jgi:hypothetical protein
MEHQWPQPAAKQALVYEIRWREAVDSRATTHTRTGNGEPTPTRGQRAVKKNVGLFRPRTEVIHSMIDQWPEKASIARLCQLLETSCSGFYAARQRRRRPRVACGTSSALTTAFHAGGGSYGSRRLRAQLHAQGCSRHHITQLGHEATAELPCEVSPSGVRSSF